MEKRCSKCGHDYDPDVVPGLEGACPRCMAGYLRSEGRGLSSFDSEAGAGGEYESPPLGEGTKLGKFEVLEYLGRGGMGFVYKAKQAGLDRLVALKVLAPRLAASPEFAARFDREAKALASLSHPNIVQVHDYGQEGDLFFLAMEFVDGTSLRRILSSQNIAPETALRYVPQLCDALECAHSQGVIHRYIKPENILIDKRGNLKIADFGLAKIAAGAAVKSDAATEPEGHATQIGQVMGTPHYMAPEQVENMAIVDHRADIYSLGVVFYEMLTGELPLGKFPVPSQRVQVDVRFDEVVLRALEKEPEKRYQRASQLKTDVTLLGGLKNTPGADSHRAFHKSSEPRPRLSRLALASALWLPAGLLVGIAAGLLVYTTFPGRRADADDAGLFFGLASAVAVGVAAFVLGLVALTRIRRFPQAIYGRGLAWCGVAGLPLLLLLMCAYFFLMMMRPDGAVSGPATDGKTIYDPDHGVLFFTVHLEQDGNTVAIVDNTAHLKRKPFRIIFEMPKETKDVAVEVNASFRPDLYDAIRAGREGIEVFRPDHHLTGVAEEDFNPDKAVIVGLSALNYWHYESATTHRFDRVIELGDRMVYARDIANLIVNEAEDETLLKQFLDGEEVTLPDTVHRKVPIEQVREKALYLLFLKTKNDKNPDRERWLQKTPLKIVFDSAPKFRRRLDESRKRHAEFAIRIDTAGAASVSGEALADKTLDDRLAAAATKAGFDRGNTVSKLKVVIRAKAQAPYSAIQRAMLACAKARIADISLAVGDEEPIPTPLPKDPGASPSPTLPEGRIEVQPPEVRIRLFRKKPGGPVLCELPAKGVGGIPLEEALELVPKMKDTWKDTHIVIASDADMPFEAVAKVLEACVKAGFTNIVFGAQEVRPAK